MVGFYFIFAIAASYSLCVSGQEEKPCFEQVSDTCDFNLFPDEFPATVDQLRDICSNVKELAACILRVRENCPDDANFTENFRQIISYIHGVCREDSEIFQVISSNLECLASASENVMQICHMLEFSDATKELIMTTLREYIGRSQAERNGDEASCLESLWDAYCPSIKIGAKCGFEVGAAAKDILLNINSNPMCTKEFIAEITPVLEVIELAVVQEELLKKMEEEEESPPAEETRRKRRFASPFQPFFDFH